MELKLHKADAERVRYAISQHLVDIDQALNSHRYSVWLAENEVMEGIDAAYHRETAELLAAAQADYNALLLYLIEEMPEDWR